MLRPCPAPEVRSLCALHLMCCLPAFLHMSTTACNGAFVTRRLPAQCGNEKPTAHSKERASSRAALDAHTTRMTCHHLLPRRAR
eukprot:292502-Prymnesium_polylepis.1